MKIKKIVLNVALLGSMAGLSVYGMEKPDENFLDINSQDEIMIAQEGDLTAKYDDIWAAVDKEDIGAVKAFLDKGVSPDEQEVLVHAASQCSVDIVKLLLERGANIYVETEDSGGKICNALNWALYNEAYEIADLLIKFGFDVNHEGSNGVLLAQHDISGYSLQWLLSRGADIAKKDSKGLTPFQRRITGEAIKYVDYKEIKQFQSLGVNINAIPAQGDHAIFKIIADGWVDALEGLIKCGLDVSIKNKEGKTPLEYAELYRVDVEKRCQLTLDRLLIKATGIGNLSKKLDFSERLAFTKNIPALVEREYEADSHIQIIKLLAPESVALIKNKQEIKNYNAFKKLGEFIVAGPNKQESVAEQMVNAGRIDIAPIASTRAPRLIEFCEHIKQTEQDEVQRLVKRGKLQN